MRILGIDVGKRRIGVAVADESESLALPHTTIEGTSDEELLAALLLVADELAADAFVVGLPLSLSGGDTPQTLHAREFASELEAVTGKTVQLMDERLSSVGAKRTIGYVEGRGGARRSGGAPRPSKAAIDKMAAATILQCYLDSRRRQSEEIDV